MIQKATTESHKASLKSARETLAKSVSTGVSSRVLDYYFAISSTEIGGDRYVEFSPRSPGSSEPPQRVLQRFYGDGRCTTLMAAGFSQGFVEKKFIYAGSQEPYTLGRVSIRNLAAWLAPSAVGISWTISDRTDGLISFTGTRDAPELASVLIEIHADPLRGFVTPLIREFDSKSRLLREYKSSNFFQPRGSDLWSPGVVEYLQNVYRDPDDSGTLRRERYEFVEHSVSLNDSLPSSLFKLEFTGSADILDIDGANKKEYYSVAPVALSVDAAEDLSSVTELRLLGPDRIKENVFLMGEQQGRRAVRRHYLFYLCLPPLILIVLWLRQRLRRGSGEAIRSLTICTCFLGLNGGCSDRSELSIAAEPVFAAVVPSAIDLGQVAATGKDIEAEICVSNRFGRDLSVEVHTGCSCTTVDAPTFRLSEDASKDVTIAIASGTRNKSINTTIRLIFLEPESDEEVGAIDVPVTMEVRSFWRAVPSRVILKPCDPSGTTGAVSISGPAEEWAQIEVRASDPQLAVVERERTRVGENEKREFIISTETDHLVLCHIKERG